MRSLTLTLTLTLTLVLAGSRAAPGFADRVLSVAGTGEGRTMVERWAGRRESVVDEQIRKATERGEFDNLPGKGKPLPGLHGPDDELWWVKQFVSREGVPSDTLLPESLRLRKEIERLAETVRELPTEDAVRAVADELNRRIVAWVRAPSGPNVPMRRVDVEQTIQRWRTEHGATGR